MKKFINPLINSGIISTGLILAACNSGSSDTQVANQELADRVTKKIGTTHLAANHPFPQAANISYHLADGTDAIYPTTRSNADVSTFYDYWKNNYIISAGTSNGQSLYRVKFGKSGSNANTTVSEGQGYGMIFTVMMAGYDENAQNLFDGLFRYVKAHPSPNNNRLMSWRQPNDLDNDSSAFDGDADIALGLILAAEQWGNTGSINYLAEAENIIAGIKESTIGKNSYLPMLGDWVAQNGSPHNQWTPRSSDFMLENFHSFAFISGNPEYWNTVINNSHLVINYMQENYSPTTGLLPDFIIGTGLNDFAPAYAGFLEGKNDENYAYNAGRDPWRLGVDALLNDDLRSLEETRKMSYWMQNSTANNPLNIHAGYYLNGNALLDESKDYFTAFFAAPYGVAAMTGGASQQEWLNNIYERIKNRHEDYYEDSITMFSLLIMTGNYWGVNTFH